jgi:hypothetical protein
MHCDALLAEIENKRNFFLADLEYEERIRQNDMDDMIKVIEKIQGSSQALQNFAKELLKENIPEFLEVCIIRFRQFLRLYYGMVMSSFSLCRLNVYSH